MMFFQNRMFLIIQDKRTHTKAGEGKYHFCMSVCLWVWSWGHGKLEAIIQNHQERKTLAFIYSYGVWHLIILELFRKITFERKQHLPTVKESDTFLQFWMFPLWKRYKRLICLTKASHISPFPGCSRKVMSWNAVLEIGPLLVSLIWTTEIILSLRRKLFRIQCFSGIKESTITCSIKRNPRF